MFKELFVIHTASFQINTNITHLDLEGNWIDYEGAKHLAYMMHENLYITELVSLAFEGGKFCGKGGSKQGKQTKGQCHPGLP